MVAAVLRTSAVQVSRRLSAQSVARTFTTSTVTKKDFVQELYLKELKAYKPAAIPKDAHIGQVKEFHTPPAPQAPQVPTGDELSRELGAFDQEVPQVSASKADSGAKVETSADDTQTQGADEYLKFVENSATHREEAHH